MMQSLQLLLLLRLCILTNFLTNNLYRQRDNVVGFRCVSEADVNGEV